MRLAIFGLSVSSSWGNGHATLWRALIRALADRGHDVTFFERDVPYYAANRDLVELPGGRLELYRDWREVAPAASAAVRSADMAIVTSYCPDAREATRLVTSGTGGLSCFYDLDTPVTLARLERGEEVPYVPTEGLGSFDLVLSYTGGRALDALRTRLNARVTAPLYGSVDPASYFPGRSQGCFHSALSHLGTYSEDRRPVLQQLFLDAARQQPGSRFLLAGPQYPDDIGWLPNVFYIPHVFPSEHRDFYASSQCTLNLTRSAMARFGHCPSGRLFEAAACGAMILSDEWQGLDAFFTPGSELVTVRDTRGVLRALEMPEAERRQMGQAARRRVLDHHTAAHRALEFEQIVESCRHTGCTSSGQ